GHRGHRPAFGFEMAPQQRDHLGIVVHDEDSGPHDCSFPLSDRTAGSQTVKTVPSPGWLATWMSLPLDFTRSRHMDRPRPVPQCAGLVLKKGSKIRGRTCSGMPDPVSRTAIATPGCSSWLEGAAVTSTRPPAGVASMAFVRRLISTCWRWPGSTKTDGNSAGT